MNHMKFRLVTVLFAALVLVLSLLGLSGPYNSELNMYLSPQEGMVNLRLITAILLVFYVFAAFSRYKLTRMLAGIAGATMIVAAVTSLFTNYIFGAYYFVLPLDFFIIIESGILMLIAAAGLPLPQRKPLVIPGKLYIERFLMNSWRAVNLAIFTLLQKLARYEPGKQKPPVKTQKTLPA
jgi:hypothetical protein